MKLLLLLGITLIFTGCIYAQHTEPIIDMHVHANRANFAGPVRMTLLYLQRRISRLANWNALGDSLNASPFALTDFLLLEAQSILN